MKIYAICDEEQKQRSAIGYLYCYEKANAYIIELDDELDEWEVPLLFQGLVKKGIYTIPKDISLLWVKERVIPSGRQNIGMIIKNANIKEYNERALLALSKGRCSQDSCYIVRVSEYEVPDNIRKRSERNVSECFVSEDEQIICLFKDNVASKIDLTQMANENKDIKYVLNNKSLLYSVKVGVGGYSIAFNDTIEILSEELRRKKWILPISANDFYGFVDWNVISSAQACDTLECSKQNLSYLAKTKRIEPIICGTKENFYTKGSIQNVVDD